MGQLYYPPDRNGLQKTLDAQLDQGTTSSMTLNNVTGVQNKAGVVVINRIDTDGNAKSASDREFVIFTGTSGNTLTGLTRGAANSTDQDHAVGSVVEFVSDVLQQQAILDALGNVVDTSDGSLDTTKVADLSTTQTLTNKTINGDNNTITNVGNPEDGWIEAGETWTFGSADDPTYTFTIGSDVTSKYSAGMRVKLTQSTGGTKYFIITGVSESGGTTTITVYGGTDYDLANEAISDPYFSTQKAPQGFPTDVSKWSVKVTDTTARSQSSPSGATWYNLGSNSIDIPIGSWTVSYQGPIYASNGSTDMDMDLKMTLSTANNSESDKELTTRILGWQTRLFGGTESRTKHLTLGSKTTYYINYFAQNAPSSSLNAPNDAATLVIQAVSAYL